MVPEMLKILGEEDGVTKLRRGFGQLKFSGSNDTRTLKGVEAMSDRHQLLAPTDPMTNLELESNAIVPNIALRQSIDLWKQEHARGVWTTVVAEAQAVEQRAVDVLSLSSDGLTVMEFIRGVV